jgi:hypothetical protein
MPHGRDEAEWAKLVHACSTFLIEQAKLRKTTSYTELNKVLSRRTHAREFDFNQDGERHALGVLLEEVGERTRRESGPMITSIVVYLGENDAGPGFYEYAKRIGYLRKGAGSDEKLEFWTGQVSATHNHYAH